MKKKWLWEHVIGKPNMAYDLVIVFVKHLQNDFKQNISMINKYEWFKSFFGKCYIGRIGFCTYFKFVCLITSVEQYFGTVIKSKNNTSPFWHATVC